MQYVNWVIHFLVFKLIQRFVFFTMNELKSFQYHYCEAFENILV